MGSSIKHKNSLIRRKMSSYLNILRSDFAHSHNLSLLFPRDVRSLIPTDADAQQQYTLKHIRKYMCAFVLSVSALGGMSGQSWGGDGSTNAKDEFFYESPVSSQLKAQPSAPLEDASFSSNSSSPPSYNEVVFSYNFSPQFPDGYKSDDFSHLSRPASVPSTAVPLPGMVSFKQSTQLIMNQDTPIETQSLETTVFSSPIDPYALQTLSNLSDPRRRYGVRVSNLNRGSWGELWKIRRYHTLKGKKGRILDNALKKMIIKHGHTDYLKNILSEIRFSPSAVTDRAAYLKRFSDRFSKGKGRVILWKIIGELGLNASENENPFYALVLKDKKPQKKLYKSRFSRESRAYRANKKGLKHFKTKVTEL